MEIFKGHKFRLDIDQKVSSTLLQWSGLNRWLYNAALKQRIMAYDLCRKSVSYFQQSKELAEMKQQLPEFKAPVAQTLQQSLKHLDAAFDRFFKGLANFPKFKRRKEYVGLHFPQIKINSIKRINKHKGQVELPKLGLVKFWWSRPITGKIKSCSLSFDGNYWFISFLSQMNAPKPKHIAESAIGIDVGCTTSIATSKPVNGQFLHNLPVATIKNLELAIAHRQKVMAYKKKGSTAWLHSLHHLRRLYYHLRCIRRDWIHKITTQIADSQSHIFVEDLDIQSMTQNPSGTLEQPGTDVAQKKGLNRSIQRQGWGLVFSCLDYKSKWKSRIYKKVNPAFSSQKCRMCKHISTKNRERGSSTFHCQRCKFVDNADVNAAYNVEEAGLALIASEEGQQLSLKNHSEALRNLSPNLLDERGCHMYDMGDVSSAQDAA